MEVGNFLSEPSGIADISILCLVVALQVIIIFWLTFSDCHHHSAKLYHIIYIYISLCHCISTLSPLRNRHHWRVRAYPGSIMYGNVVPGYAWRWGWLRASYLGRGAHWPWLKSHDAPPNNAPSPPGQQLHPPFPRLWHCPGMLDVERWIEEAK